MYLIDVNIYLNSLNASSNYQSVCYDLITSAIDKKQLYVYEPTLMSVVRIGSSKKSFSRPLPVENLLKYAETIITHPNVKTITPSETHWNLFKKYMKAVKYKHKFITDAYLAALAVENHCTFVTDDDDFIHFKDLKVKYLDDLA